MSVPVPPPVALDPFRLAQRFVGLAEDASTASNPHVLAMLRLDSGWPAGDDVPWCSAFANYVCWLLRAPRSKDLRARSWLGVGAAVPLEEAVPGWDVVVLSRGKDPAQGHVGFYAGREGKAVLVLGGNQGDRVSVASFDAARVVGVRRLVG